MWDYLNCHGQVELSSSESDLKMKFILVWFILFVIRVTFCFFNKSMMMSVKMTMTILRTTEEYC